MTEYYEIEGVTDLNQLIWECDFLKKSFKSEGSTDLENIMADVIVKMTKQDKCLRWIVCNGDYAHPSNIVAVAKGGLSDD